MSACYRRLSCRSFPSIIIASLVILSAVAAPVEAALARSSSNSEICQRYIEAVMWGNIDAAMDAIDPGPDQHELFKSSLTRLNSLVIDIVKGKTPRLERALEDIKVENYPASLQIWNLGEDDVHVIGCLFRIEENKTIQIDFQLSDTVEEVVDGFKANLK